MTLGFSGSGTVYNREGTAPRYSTTGALPTQANEGDLAVITENDPNEIYSYEALSSTWKKIGTAVAGFDWYVEQRAITGAEITNKELTLANSPAGSTAIIVDIIGGVAQGYTTDYSITGSTLSWNGKGLDGVLEEDDVIRVSYKY